ncbi:MAG: hypothetical protein EBT86_07120 [Actinobacteria bacterium]|nr:hypothetical protein [Actinomycetota bacterium]
MLKSNSSVTSRPSFYYSNIQKWKSFLDEPNVKTKSWMDLTEFIIRCVETDEIRNGTPWIWIIDMYEQSLLYRVFLDNLPNITKYLMKRWENTLIQVIIIRPSATTNTILKIIETVIPRDRLANLHRISGGLLEINNKLEKLGLSTEERMAIKEKLL